MGNPHCVIDTHLQTLAPGFRIPADTESTFSEKSAKLGSQALVGDVKRVG